jgi:hypothetical protein
MTRRFNAESSMLILNLLDGESVLQAESAAVPWGSGQKELFMTTSSFSNI